MRAWVFHGNKDVRLEALPEPTVGPGEVAVHIAYNGICGSDLHEYFHGPLFIPMHEEHPTTGHKGPVTLGHEASGTIAAVGEGVHDVHVGQRVTIEPIVRTPTNPDQYNLNAAFYGLMAPGFLADTAVVQRSAVHLLPEGVSLADGALTEPLSVAWHAVVRSGLAAGQSAVVFGGGPIGIGAALSLRARGIERVCVVEPAPSRRAVLERLGLAACDPGNESFQAEIRQVVGTAADAVIDAAGVPAAITEGIDLLGPHGRLVVVAAHMVPVPIDTNQLLIAERSLVASMAYRDDFPQVLAQQAAGAFPSEAWVETIPFEDLIEAGLERLATGKAIKVLVEVGIP
jgi:(R,R)-butanediol dehydrogenase/meso-butanediol dehydrogenase/diacetyl reductase